MKTLIAIAALSLLAAPAVAGPIDSPFAYNYGKGKLKAQLEEDGYKAVEITFAVLNRSPLQCGSDSQKFLYKATYDGQKVSGFACYRGMLWGIAYWDD